MSAVEGRCAHTISAASPASLMTTVTLARVKSALPDCAVTRVTLPSLVTFHVTLEMTVSLVSGHNSTVLS